jgi:hypothetical protein
MHARVFVAGGFLGCATLLGLDSGKPRDVPWAVP